MTSTASERRCKCGQPIEPVSVLGIEIPLSRCPDCAERELREEEAAARVRDETDALARAGANERLLEQTLDGTDPDLADQLAQVRAWLDAYRDGERQNLWLSGNIGTGKMQPYGAKIIAPEGIREMGDLRVGDRVCNPNGTTSRVVAIFENGVRPIYRVTLSDGTHADAGDEHLWAARFASDSRSYPYRVATTHQLAEALARGKCVLLPVTEPVSFSPPRRDRRRIDPYVLGVLLGDGCLSGRGVTLSAAEPEIVARVGERIGHPLPPPQPASVDRCPTYTLPVGTRIPLGLEETGLRGCRSWEKFIPPSFLTAPTEERWELLRGLLDTDGYAGRRSIEFVTVSPRLSVDVATLVRSLGGTAKIAEKQTDRRLAYRLHLKFRDPALAFSLPRKVAVCRPPQAMYRKVVAVEEIGRELCRCIAVSDPNGLYLTDDFIVTHNTWVAWGVVRELALDAVARYYDADEEFRGYGPGTPALFVNWRDLLSDMKDEYRSGTGGATGLYGRACRVRVLALDDLGAERPTPWALESLAGLVQARYDGKLPTIVTSNFYSDELAARIGHADEVVGKRIVSRLVEGAVGVRFEGDSRRRRG